MDGDGKHKNENRITNDDNGSRRAITVLLIMHQKLQLV